MPTFLDTAIEYLKGVGPAKAELLKKELELFRYSDLIKHYPFRYVDRSRIYTIKEIQPDFAFVQIRGKFRSLSIVGERRGKRLVGEFTDGESSIEVVWFRGIQWIEKSINLNREYILFGKPGQFGRSLNMPHPELLTLEQFKKEQVGGLQPIYSTTEKLKAKGLDSRGIQRLVVGMLTDRFFEAPEYLPPEIIDRYKLPDRVTALRNIHVPQNEELNKRSKYRIKFEEFFFTQVRMLMVKGLRKRSLRGIPFKSVGDHFNNFYKNHLPFDLTDDQQKVIKEIHADMASGKQMNRLLQGDVGSGKTIVAFLCMLLSLDNDCQAALMAPTEILATQHYESLKEFADLIGLRIELLTGSTSKAKRKVLHEDLLNGDIHILIGTHALIEDQVKFQRLGLVVIDEQHRFGVQQRAKLWTKGEEVPHVLVMTATPIPRTLSMTLYGDLDVSRIEKLPPGRKAVKTVHRFESGRLRVYGFLKEQIQEGRQVYLVFPLIEESSKMDYANLMEGYENILREFPRPDYQVSIVHGKMKAADKEAEMQRFKNRETQIMVATSVIEVGVNVPNASVMVIESAERFGLSQLHQLRGRVGRGADQSYCILMSGHKLSKEARMRLDAMVSTTDGFEIAELDLKLRGPGEIDGLRQSGLSGLKLADLTKDQEILQLSRHAAETLLTHDPKLEQPAHQALLAELKKQYKGTDWSRIS